MQSRLLELKNISKTFPGVKALDGVHFDLKAGEIHALMGENGAGKSTFIKVITGAHQPDPGGEIILDGKPITFTNPRAATVMGIAAIYQHVTSYPDLSVTENIFIGHEETDPKTRRILWKSMHEKAQGFLRQLGSVIDPRTQMGMLSVAQQQIVEIAKALSTNARIIIMDEPTAALTKSESEELYRITLQLKAEGKGIIFISHRFEDMYRVADRVTVLRDSKYIGVWNVSEITQKELIFAMVGRDLKQMYPTRKSEPGEELLRVEGLCKTGYFKDISFDLRRGEILSIYGLVGAGRSEVSQAIYGTWGYDAGHVFLEGKEISIRNPKHSLKTGIGYLPEDRQKQGLVMDWSIARNITLATLEQYSKNGLCNVKAEEIIARDLFALVNIKAQSIQDLANSLSGGNQQKVIVAKILASKLKVLILDEPTKGVDVGAKFAIYEIMRELAAKGIGIVMITSEIPEVLGMSDRVVVMREGRVTRILETSSTTQEEILTAAIMDKHTKAG